MVGYETRATRHGPHILRSWSGYVTIAYTSVRCGSYFLILMCFQTMELSILCYYDHVSCSCSLRRPRRQINALVPPTYNMCHVHDYGSWIIESVVNDVDAVFCIFVFALPLSSSRYTYRATSRHPDKVGAIDIGQTSRHPMYGETSCNEPHWWILEDESSHCCTRYISLSST